MLRRALQSLAGQAPTKPSLESCGWTWIYLKTVLLTALPHKSLVPQAENWGQAMRIFAFRHLASLWLRSDHPCK